jgi:hypothetical protein
MRPLLLCKVWARVYTGGTRITTGTVETVCRDLWPEMDVEGFSALHLRDVADDTWEDASTSIETPPA